MLSVLFVGYLWAPAVLADASALEHSPAKVLPASTNAQLDVRVSENSGIRRLRVRYRTQGTKRYKRVDFALKKPGLFVAEIPGSDVQMPGLEYFIVQQNLDGTVQLAFAAPKSPVQIPVADKLDEKEQGASGDGLATSRVAGGEQAPQGEPTGPMTKEREREEQSGTTANRAAEDSVGESPTAQEAGDTKPVPQKAATQDAVSTDSDGVRFGTLKPRVLKGGVLAQRENEGPQVAALDEAFLVYGARAAGLNASSRREREFDSIFVQTWSEKDFQRFGANTVGEVLKHLFGMETSRSILGYDRVSVHGLRRDGRIVVFLDGNPINNPYDGRALWSLPTILLEEVRLETGSGVNQISGSAGGAVVHLRTRRTPGVDAIVYGHSYLGAGAAISGAAKLGSLELAGGGDVHVEEGPHLLVESDAYTDSEFEREDPLMQTQARALRGAGVGRATYRFGESQQNQVYGQTWLNGEWRGPYVGAFDTVGPESQLVWVASGAAVGAKAEFGEVIGVDLNSTVDQHYTDILVQLTPEDFTTADRDDDGQEEEFPAGIFYRRFAHIMSHRVNGVLTVKPFAGNRIQSGVRSSISIIPPNGYALEANRTINGEAQELGEVADFAIPENDPCSAYGVALPIGGGCRQTSQFFLHDTQNLFDRLRVGAGLRVSSFSDLNFDLFSHLNPWTELTWMVTDQLQLQGKLSTGLSPPTLEEKYDQRAQLYSDLSRGDYFGNPDLVSESFRQADLGASYSFNVLNSSHRLRAIGYLMHVGDAIEKIPVNGVIEQFANAGDYYIGGAEGGWVSSFGERGGVFMNASWFRSYWIAPPDLDVEAPVCSVTQAVMRDAGLAEGDGACTIMTDIPQMRANVGAFVDFGYLGALGTVIQLGVERRSNSRATLERIRQYRIPAYSLLNMTYRTPALFDFLGLYVQGTNMLNHPAQDDVPRPDRIPGLLPREGLRLLGGVYVDL